MSRRCSSGCVPRMKRRSRQRFREPWRFEAKGPEKELADLYFLETLVRIHRAGEGPGETRAACGAARLLRKAVSSSARAVFCRSEAEGLVRSLAFWRAIGSDAQRARISGMASPWAAISRSSSSALTGFTR
jgi:hypothetical protein